MGSPTRWARVAALAVGACAAVGSAACSSSPAARPPSTPSSVPAGAGGLGASLSAWKAAHAGITGGYGSRVTVDGHPVPEFTALKVEDGKVTGWHMSFKPGTHLATAESLIRAQLPAEVQQTASWRGTFGGARRYCEFINFRSGGTTATGTAGSPTPPQAIGVTVYEATPRGPGTSGIVEVNSADITSTARTPGQAC